MLRGVRWAGIFLDEFDVIAKLVDGQQVEKLDGIKVGLKIMGATPHTPRRMNPQDPVDCGFVVVEFGGPTWGPTRLTKLAEIVVRHAVRIFAGLFDTAALPQPSTCRQPPQNHKTQPQETPKHFSDCGYFFKSCPKLNIEKISPSSTATALEEGLR